MSGVTHFRRRYPRKPRRPAKHYRFWRWRLQFQRTREGRRKLWQGAHHLSPNRYASPTSQHAIQHVRFLYRRRYSHTPLLNPYLPRGRP